MLNLDTWELCYIDNKKSNCEIIVPWYFWRHGAAVTMKELPDKVFLLKRSTLDFHDLQIKFLPNYRDVKVRFKDTVTQQQRLIEVSVNIEEEVRFRNGNRREYELKGFEYTMKSHDFEKQWRQDVDVRDHYRDFSKVMMLGMHSEGHPNGADLNYGVDGRQFTVSCNGRTLSGTTYVMLCGSWAILLSDDFKFDALVTIKSLKSYVLDVDKFIYSNNPYITKMMFLMR